MIVKQNQSTFDLATQIYGDVRSVLDFCVENDFSLTQDLAAGSSYVDTETIYQNDIVEDFYFNTDYELATSEPKAERQPIGIGTMIVESDFDVT